MITVPKEKCPWFNGNEMAKEIGHIYQRKIRNQDIRSVQHLGYYEIV